MASARLHPYPFVPRRPVELTPFFFSSSPSRNLLIQSPCIQSPTSGNFQVPDIHWHTSTYTPRTQLATQPFSNDHRLHTSNNVHAATYSHSYTFARCICRRSIHFFSADFNAGSRVTTSDQRPGLRRAKHSQQNFLTATINERTGKHSDY